MGYSQWSLKESDKTERLPLFSMIIKEDSRIERYLIS